MQLDSVTEDTMIVERATDKHAATAAAPILVAVDFSAVSEAALLWACAHAEKIGAPVEVLHVVHDPADAPGTYNGADALEPMSEVAERKLAEFLARALAHNPEAGVLQSVRTFCRPGLPPGTIVDLAREHGAQHLVLGSRGRNGLSRVVLGSTSEHVVRHAPMPVTIIKAKTK